tara:strand:- start:2400 stop:2873 length:474 start_codon:yes stop_codon:yes gene_type:complete
VKPIQENVLLLRQQVRAVLDTAAVLLRQLDNEGSAALRRASKVPTIQRVVMEEFMAPPDYCSSRSRRRAYVEPRMVALYLSRELTKHTLDDIASKFRSDMDRDTVMHACATIEARLHTEEKFAARVAETRARCEQEIENADLPLFASLGQPLNQPAP